MHTLDVFTTDRFAGNPLAVVHIPDDPILNDTVSQATKQKIAREFNLSETVMLHPVNKDNPWKRRIDIFTPSEELPFAGHPTIGTLCLWASQDENLRKGTLLTKAGPISFAIDRVSRPKITASANIPHNIHTHKTLLSGSQVRSLQPSLEPRIKSLPTSGWPLVWITKGMTFALIDISSMEELSNLNRTPSKPEVKLDDEWAPSFVGCYYYFREPDTDDAGATVLHTRMIEPEVGEDPVTGSAACALSAYLALKMFENEKKREIDFRVIQGEHMGRMGSPRITVNGTPYGGISKIILRGEALEVMNGTIKIDIKP